MNILRNTLRAGLAATALAVPAAAQTTLTISSWAPPNHPLTKDVVYAWGATVEKASQGRMKFQILPKHPSAPPGTIDAVRDGLVDVSFITAGYLPARFVLSLLPELPGGGETAAINSVAYSRIHFKYFEQVNEYRGVKLLAVFTHGPGQMFNSKKPIAKMADMQGLKFRVGGGMAEKMATALGASAFVKPAPEFLRAALERCRRRHFLPAGFGAGLQAQVDRQIRHAVPGRLLRFVLRLLHERGQVQEAVQGRSGRDPRRVRREIRAHRRRDVGCERPPQPRDHQEGRRRHLGGESRNSSRKSRRRPP